MSASRIVAGGEWSKTNAVRGEFERLTALRGLAALWVFAGHAVNLAAAKVPIVDQPSMAVDVFILLSGFVMVYTSRGSGTFAQGRWLQAYRSFVVRRFWRLSPAFLVVFAIAMVLGPWTGELRQHLTALGSPAPQAERYTDTSLVNIALHITYLFGLLPQYASRSPLPDWSISLEMQFYLLFPFLWWSLRRAGYFGLLLIVTLTLALVVVFADYFDAFTKPSVLPLKLNLFLAGMVLANLVSQHSKMALTLLLAVVLASLPTDGALLAPRNLVRPALVLLVGLVIIWDRDESSFWLSRLLLWRPLLLAGQISYSVYLSHLVILVPIAALLAAETAFRGLALALIAWLASFPLVMAASMLLYRFVEKPGIALGRHGLRKGPGANGAKAS